MIPNRLTPGYAPSAIKAATAPLPPDLAADSVFLLVEGTLLGLGDVTLVPTVRRALAGARRWLGNALSGFAVFGEPVGI